MEIPLLSDLIIILGLSILVILIFHKLQLPNVLGFLFTGMIAGPYGLSLVEAYHEVDVLAEIGVVLLLFVIGLEFSLKSLLSIKRAVLLGGSIQVGVTIAVFGFLAYLLKYPINKAVFIGFLFALSSTAIVLKLFQQRGEITSPHGNFSLAVLIFQDIIVVPMMLFTPILAGGSENVALELLLLGAKGLAIIGVVLVCARYLVPWLLYWVAQTRSRELFILTIVVICFSVAWLTSLMGLSLALGAFLAGLIISESDYSYQATGNILPFSEIFTSIFFVSIGMLMDVFFLIDHIGLILILTLVTFIVKGGLASFAAWILKYPPRTIMLVGLALFQVGEFAFILSKTGMDAGIMTQETYQYFLSVSILTMAVTPFSIRYGESITNFVLGGKVISGLMHRINRDTGKPASEVDKDELKDQLIIIGYGLNGRNVANAAKRADIPYVILELNAQTVQREQANGEPIYYGDAIHANILNHLNIQNARVVVVAISDPTATKRIISNIRQLSKMVHIIVRTRFLQEVEENLSLGADEVIPEEFETSIEIFTRVLSKYLVPMDEIEEFTKQIRSANYEMLREVPAFGGKPNQFSLALPEVEIVALKVEKAQKGIVGVPIGESKIRQEYKVNVVGIKRNNEYIFDLHGDIEVHKGDVLYVVGKPDNLKKFNKEISN